MNFKKKRVCGELASDPAYVKKMMKIGIATVSVSAKLIPGVRKAALAQIVQVNRL